tara:strand:+ start:345 stop:554 length:210 start_codon:yes stop_codon:yes gene_type:complete
MDNNDLFTLSAHEATWSPEFGQDVAADPADILIAEQIAYTNEEWVEDIEKPVHATRFHGTDNIWPDLDE